MKSHELGCPFYDGAPCACVLSIEHDCLEHLKYEWVEWVERHGLDCGPFAHCCGERWVCVLCGERFTAEELEQRA